MSAERDFIFPQPDTLLSPDFEDFTKTLLLGNAFQSIAGTYLMGDLENKGNFLLPAWPEVLCNFTSFSPIIEQEKCFKLDENSKEGQLGFHSYAPEEPNCGMPCNGGVDELQRELIVMEPHFEQVELPLSPITRIATRKLHHMNLNELEGLQVPSSPSLSVEVPSFSGSLMNSSVHTCNSAGSPPTHSSSDGREDLISELFAITDSLEAFGSNLLKKQAAGSVTGTDSMGTHDNKFVGTRKKPIPPHMVEEATQCTFMQRSHSSNALGSISSTLDTRDDCGIASFPNQNPSLPRAFSNFSPSNVHLVPDLNMQPSIRSMRKVYSTGDLKMQAMDESQMSYFKVNLLPREQSNLDESCMRIGCYTLDERRQKLHRYRQKRSERNFGKKIKYACRKTLADSRPRIRGRFARTDESEELVS